MNWKAFLGLLPFLLSAGLALTLALSYKAFKKRRERRSPLADKQIGHVPGQQLVARMADHEADLLLAVMLMYMAFPLMFMAWVSQRFDLTAIRWGFPEWLSLAAAILLFCYGLYSYARHLHARDNIRDGLLAERVTGMQLNRLVAQGCIVMHDLPCGDYNIDHVVIAPRGIFAVETKSFRKPKNRPPGEPAKVIYNGDKLEFSDFSTRKPIEQSRRQASSLSKFLREILGEPVRVDPAVSLPGWWVEKTDEGKASDVFVFTPMGRGCEWFAYGDEVIPQTKRNLIAQALATRYPSVT
jgi:hypothetical protein